MSGEITGDLSKFQVGSVDLPNQLTGTLDSATDIVEVTSKSSNQRKQYLPANLGVTGTVSGFLTSDPALDLDGATEFADVADDSDLDLTTLITMEAIFQPDAVAGTQTLAHKHDGTDGYILRLEGDEVEFVIDNSGTTDAAVKTNAANLVVTRQYSVKAIYEGAGNTVKIYIDEIVEAATTTGTIPDACGVNATRLTVGANAADGDKFDGKLWHIAIAALGTDNTQRLTQAESVAYYKFNGVLTDTATGGANNPHTLTGTNITSADYGELTFLAMREAQFSGSTLALSLDESGTGLTYSFTGVLSSVSRSYPQNDGTQYTINFNADGPVAIA